MQVRTQYFRNVIDDAIASSAYNLDVSYAVWRTCFEGEEQWLNTVDRTKDYAAGDVWGCIGRWYAGRWYTDAAKEYLSVVYDYYQDRVWESDGFLQ
jgi:autotransporter family porin